MRSNFAYPVVLGLWGIVLTGCVAETENIAGATDPLLNSQALKRPWVVVCAGATFSPNDDETFKRAECTAGAT